jgi:phenylalanyl-tRNA synthetase alpha chain
MWDFESIRKFIDQDKAAVHTVGELESFRNKYLAKKGLIAEMYASLGKVPVEEKSSIGKHANEWKAELTAFVDGQKRILEDAKKKSPKETIDVTMPGAVRPIGHPHILSKTMDEICGIFGNLGFVRLEGPEIETEFNNFDGLNIPAEHPSRDGFDTFYVDAPDPDVKGRALILRSQTSPMQVRVMKANTPPLAVVVPGKVYRPDAVDASHSFMFHQIEGLVVDTCVQFSDLKGLMTEFCHRFFSPDIRMRFRPHFFPFTEPSAEVDISCYMCGGKGCSTCGQKGWLEIMGCGMVHPNVFKASGYPSGKYTGLAFGLGVERIAMLKYGIHDIRLFYENDKRFLEQF